MNFLFLFLLLMLMSCNQQNASSLNPMNNVIEALSPETGTSENWREEYLQLVNAHRQSRGLRAFTYSKEIEAEAQKHSENMAQKLIPFGHTGSTLRCTQIKTALGGGNLCGEIVASGQKTPADVYVAWMSSTAHRQKIESTRYTYTGLGYAKNLAGTIYWTQIFLEL